MLRKLFSHMVSIVLLFLMLLAGCTRRDTSKSVTFEQEPTDYTLLIVVDIDLIKSNPEAISFVTYAIEHYFRERIGSNDHIVISQLSGNNQPLLFQGKPRFLLEKFASPEDFRQFLISRSDPGRRINDGISESLDYLAHTSSVVRGGAAPIALIVSSMVDDHPESKESDDRVMAELIKFGNTGGQMAFYFCNQQRMASVREKMEKAGFGWEILECDVNGRPPLPTFHR